MPQYRHSEHNYGKRYNREWQKYVPIVLKILPMSVRRVFVARIDPIAPASRPPQYIVVQMAGTRHSPEAASQTSETDEQKESGKPIEHNCNGSTFPKRNRKLKLPQQMILPGASPRGQHRLKREARSSTPAGKQ